MARNIVVRASSCPTPAEREVEICEHKGVGHPDTITDAVCEAASRELSLAYRQAYGVILHHNVDKGLLVGGRSRPHFGGGEIEEPARVIIAGRASRVDARVDPGAVALAAARRVVSEELGFDIEHFALTTAIGEGAANLRDIFARRSEVPLANDTSIGVGFAPYSPLETLVLACADEIKTPRFRDAFPAAGLDYKVMGLRRGGEVTLTVALAFVDRHVTGVAEYFAIKEAVRDRLASALGSGQELRINTLDDSEAKDESGVYLTVSGTSAEMGDDGQVGRGNRASRLITPGRPMSLEATAGKNPVSHVGKIYNVLAMEIAREIHERIAVKAAVSVELLSSIGVPIDEPQIASIEIAAKDPLDAATLRQAGAIAEDRLKRAVDVTELVLARRADLF